MQKNWLIRTKQKQILGPVAQEKVVEFLKKGAISDEDELCSGNGFWFYVKEKDLLEQYLIGNETQPFNPVSEARTVLATTDGQEMTFEQTSYEQRGQTQVINLSEIALDKPEPEKSSTSSIKLPNADDLAYPEIEQGWSRQDMDLKVDDEFEIELDGGREKK